MYTGKMNPSVWLEDFRLACRAGGANDDFFIIQYLPICVGEYVRAWLEFLPPNSIRSWAELKQVFIGNFGGRTCTPETPRTSSAGSRSPASPFGTTSAGSLSNAIISLTSLTWTTLARSSLGPPVGPLFINSAAESRAPPACSWTSP
jgi:hypothetical protein